MCQGFGFENIMSIWADCLQFVQSHKISAMGQMINKDKLLWLERKLPYK